MSVPTDGPSAGIAMRTALVSRLSGRPVGSEVGMTGEVTLQGKVLSINIRPARLPMPRRLGPEFSE